MDATTQGALIGAAATIIAAIVGKIPVMAIVSHWNRKRHDIPDIVKTVWTAKWYDENENLYIKDSIRIEKWTKNSNFKGYGYQIRDMEKQDACYKYPIEGEVSPNRIVILTYKAEKFPTEANIGAACMQLSTNAQSLEGYWAGYGSKQSANGTKVDTIRFGRVTMNKIKDT